MKVWKPLTKFYYSNERNEYKYHTDFSLGAGEEIEVIVNGETILLSGVPKGMVKKYHFEMAVESFAEKPEEYNGEPVSEIKAGFTD